MKISTRKRLAALVTMGAMLVGMLAGCGGSRKSTYGIILELRVYRWNSRNGWMSIMPRATRPS